MTVACTVMVLPCSNAAKAISTTEKPMPSAAFHIETGNNASQPALMASMPTLMSNEVSVV